MGRGRQQAWQPESTLLRLGIAAARAGHKADARQFFRQMLRMNPHHELAWMWMGGVVETDAERVHCLRQVLMIDPTNVAARRGLDKIKARMMAESTAPAPPPPPTRGCPHCGTPNRESSSFCTECGQSLAEPLTPSVQPSEEQKPSPVIAPGTSRERIDPDRVLLTVIFVLLLTLLIVVCSLSACLICRTWVPAWAGMG